MCPWWYAFGVNGEDCDSWVLLWTKKFGRRVGELEKGVGEEASKVEVCMREPVERLRFIDMLATRQIEWSRWRLIDWADILVDATIARLGGLLVEWSRQRKWTRPGRSTRVVTAALRQHFHMSIVHLGSFSSP